MTSHLLRLWVIGSYEMPRCDWLQHCNFLAGIEILPTALQTACKPCGFATGRPAIVAGPVLRVAIGESCSMCRALKEHIIVVAVYLWLLVFLFICILSPGFSLCVFVFVLFFSAVNCFEMSSTVLTSDRTEVSL